MTTFHIHHNKPSFNLHGICSTVRTLHVIFVLIFAKGIAPRLACFILDNLNVLDGPKGFHFAEQLAFGNFVRQATNEQRIVTVHAREFSPAFALGLSVRFNGWFELLLLHSLAF
jgi:hypothetical protein